MLGRPRWLDWPGGSHARLLKHLDMPLPSAELRTQVVWSTWAMAPPISLWHDPDAWAAERERQFPGSQRFRSLCHQLHASNWQFASQDPVVTPRSLWDLSTLLRALRPATLASGLFTGLTIADLLQLCGCGDDQRLRRFLVLQLMLYSQERADSTAALYVASVLLM